MCLKVQQAVIDVLIHKTLKAAKDHKVKSVILGGGVAANNELRRQFKEKIEKDYYPPTTLQPKPTRPKKETPTTPYIKFYIPDSKLCTDNAAMTAAAAYYHWLKRETKTWRNIKAKANLRIS